MIDWGKVFESRSGQMLVLGILFLAVSLLLRHTHDPELCRFVVWQIGVLVTLAAPLSWIGCILIIVGIGRMAFLDEA
jgi:hypothetical protein